MRGRAGPFPIADGSVAPARLSRDGSSVVQHSHARYQEAVLRGNVYVAGNFSPLTHSLAGVAAQGVILINPKGSGKNLVVLSITSVISAAVTGVAAIALCANSDPAAADVIVTSVLNNHRNALLGGPKGVGLVADSATLPATPQTVRQLYGWHWVAGGTPTTQLGVNDPVDGQIILMPGTSVAIQSRIIAHSAMSTICWEEVPQ